MAITHNNGTEPADMSSIVVYRLTAHHGIRPENPGRKSDDDKDPVFCIQRKNFPVGKSVVRSKSTGIM